MLEASLMAAHEVVALPEAVEAEAVEAEAEAAEAEVEAA